MDGTSSIVPKGYFKHILIIYIEYMEQIFPIFFILMDKKSQNAYKTLFSYINENIFNLEPNIIITDYETAMRNSLGIVFPMCKLLRCWFHYTQAVRRNIETKFQYLAKFIHSSSIALTMYYKILGLLLLPAKDIVFAFNQLKLNIKLFDNENKFGPFISYFEKQWLKKEGADKISLFKQMTRTTSAVEAFNGVIGRMLKTHGNFFKMFKEEFHKANKFETIIESGGAFGILKRKRINIERSDKINEASDLLKKGKITVMLFLNRIAYADSKIFNDTYYVDFEFDDDDDNNESNNDSCSNNSEDQTFESSTQSVIVEENMMCIICLENPSNVELLPCRYLKLCQSCQLLTQAEAISQKGNKYLCPCCRQVVEDSIQVFT